MLALDSICFEQRCKDPTVGGFDFVQHFDKMCYRIISGEYLMKKVLNDAMNGITLSELDSFDSKWSEKYPKIAKSWRDNWANLSTYFKYPEAVRRLI